MHLDGHSKPSRARKGNRQYGATSEETIVVRSVLHAVMRHRLILSYDALADHISADQVIDEIIAQVAVG